MTDDFPPSPKRRRPAKPKAKAAPSPKPKPPAKRDPLPKGGATAILDHVGIAGICERLANGELLTEIARSLGVGRVTLGDWLAADPDRSARAREAREIGAEAEDDKALQVLVGASTDSSAHVAKAREIAQHRRWRASKLAPKIYGERLAVDATFDPSLATLDELQAQLRRELGLPATLLAAVSPDEKR